MHDAKSNATKSVIAYDTNVVKNVAFFLNIPVLWSAEGYYHAAFIGNLFLIKGLNNFSSAILLEF